MAKKIILRLLKTMYTTVKRKLSNVIMYSIEYSLIVIGISFPSHYYIQICSLKYLV